MEEEAARIHQACYHHVLRLGLARNPTRRLGRRRARYLAVTVFATIVVTACTYRRAVSTGRTSRCTSCRKIPEGSTWRGQSVPAQIRL